MGIGLEIVGEIGKETYHIFFFIVAVILSGSVINRVYYGERYIDIKSILTILAGTVLNIIVLFLYSWAYPATSVDFSWENLKIYTSLKVWMILAIVTSLGGLSTWEYKRKGNKWIKNVIVDTFLFIFGFMSFIISLLGLFQTLVNLPNVFINPFKISNTLQFFKELVKLLGGVVVVCLFGYVGINIVRLTNRVRRYKKRSS